MCPIPMLRSPGRNSQYAIYHAAGTAGPALCAQHGGRTFPRVLGALGKPVRKQDIFGAVQSVQPGLGSSRPGRGRQLRLPLRVHLLPLDGALADWDDEQQHALAERADAEDLRGDHPSLAWKIGVQHGEEVEVSG